jgi:anti-sigma factor RsiW
MTIDHAAAREVLAPFIAGTLERVDRSSVSEHLMICEVCRADAAAWRAVRAACRSAPGPAVAEPSTAVIVVALSRATMDRTPGKVAPVPVDRRSLPAAARFVVDLLAREARLLHTNLWVPSALALLLGAVLAMTVADRGDAGVVFGLVAPFVAAVGAVMVPWAESGGPDDLVLTTRTSRQSVLLARLGLVVGYNALISLICSILLALTGVSSLGAIVGHWFGPMLLVSAFAFALSVWFGLRAGFVGLGAVGLLQLMTGSPNGPFLGGPLAVAIQAVWSTNLFTILVAGALVFAALRWSPERSRLDSRP